MSDVTIDQSLHRFTSELVTEIDGPADDPTLAITVSETVVLDPDGATRGAPELTLRTGPEGITFTDRDQVLQLQAAVNRAINQWRESATHLP